jgi:predicted AlkP superfamily pyrophosphatase or phosphodiesterase
VTRRLFTASLLLAIALTSPGAEASRRRAVLVSFDALAGTRLQELLAQPDKLAFGGFRRIAERGFVASRSVPPSPALTAVSHITIATGALPSATGIVGNWMLDRSKPFGKTISGFDAPIRAETLWEAAHRQGKRVGVVLFPGADGKAPGRTADWALTWPPWPPLDGVRQRLAAADWRRGETSERSFSPPRRRALALGSSGHAFTAVAIDSTDDGRVNYDHVRVEPESGVAADVSPGGWFAVEVKASEGRTGAWCKLLSLAPDLSSAEIYVGPLNRNLGYPREFIHEVDERIGFWPGAGDDKAFGGLSDHPEVLYEQLDRLADFLTRVQLLAIARNDWDLLLLYQPEVDTLSHAFWLTDPAQKGFTWERAAAFRRLTDRAYELADRSLDSIERALSPNDGIFVTSDHGMTPIWTEIYPNELLRHAGLLKLNARREVDPSSAAFAACDGALAHVYRNPGADPSIVAQIAALFAQFRLQGESPFEAILRREEAGSLGLDAPESGDLIVFGKPGVHFARGLPKEPSPVRVPTESGTHGYMNHHTQIQASFLAAGPGIAHEKTETIHSWEIAAWVCKLLGIDPPRDAARAAGPQPLAR